MQAMNRTKNGSLWPRAWPRGVSAQTAWFKMGTHGVTLSAACSAKEPGGMAHRADGPLALSSNRS
jgi:hypothetical protein